jgi:hypothetical protein
MRWSPTDPGPQEAIIVDEAAEEAARVSLGREVAELGYSLHNARVSRLGEAKIVRLDVYDPARRKNVAVAIRVERPDEIDEAVHLFGP